MTENHEQKSRNTKKKKKRNYSIFRMILLIVILIGFIGTGALGGLVFAFIKSAKPIDVTKIDSVLSENSFIFDKEGNLIEKVESDILRTPVEYSQIPEHLRNAIIAIEDRDFKKHNGISIKGIIRATWENLKARGPVQGASTITQQLAKNLYLSNEKKISRKIIEAYYALQIEKHLSKEQILTAYLNAAYFGAGAQGVQAAAQAYFSKDVSQLDLAESALIAGITKNPAKFSPLKTLRKEDVDPNKHFIIDDSDEIYTIVYDERYKDRQHLVLKIMKDEKMITEEEYQEALHVDIKERLKPGGKQVSSGISSYFVDQVKRDVIQALMKELDKTEEEAKDMLYNQGLRIYSTMDLKMQKILEKVYEDSRNFPNLIAKKDGAGNLLSKNGSILLYKYDNLINSNEQLIIPKGDYQYDTEGNLVLFKGRRLNFDPLYENGEVKGIQVAVRDAYTLSPDKEYLMHKGGPIKIPSQYKSYDGKNNLVIHKEFLEHSPEFFSKGSNDSLLISKENYYMSDKGVVQPQSAMVIMDYHTGEIKALVGGRDIKGKKLYNRAINPRQPGSAIKPLSVYTPAIDNGWTAADVVDDVPNYDQSGRLWPKNWYKGYHGLSTLREGVQWSINVLAVKIGEQIGINTSIEYLKKMGITTIDEKGGTSDLNLAAMALGGMTKGISPLELTAAYGSLANNGVYIRPKSFVKITDRDGNVILENTSFKNLVVKPEVAFIVTDMMKSVVSAGTGQKAKLDRENSVIPVAGKTGTTSDNYDAWFVGYTPYYVGGVWIGNDVQMELASGSALSAQLWKTVMAKVHEGLPPRDFEKPENIISVKIDTKSGKLPTEISYQDPRGTVRTEYFIRGTEPKEYDDVHVELEVDTSTNKLATPYCPPTLVEKRIFIKRPIPYNPGDHGGIVPDDYIYEVPGMCDVHNAENNGIIIDPLQPLPFPTVPKKNENNNNLSEDPIETPVIDSGSN
ncbi:transglycosylase domain-containing protein [Thermotalea metallivorans]|uniref:Penicillin-binding protein 1A n=1 Tax=Thermotalea metallivorans TaxID=520762 RepID=A0A140L0X9_9FIRM|nr:PBP1A family penicillin-binding protein [Thermotalea metallivorans]KXG74204.1 Penicillin-binding protein 1A [Thermotalea metallivorans]